MGKKILFALTNHEKLGNTGKATGAHFAEITHPYEVFHKAGYQIDMTSPRGGLVPLDHVDLDDEINRKWHDDSSFMNQLKSTMKPSDVHAEQYEAIYYPGGHGTMFDLPQSQGLQDLTSEIYEAGGVVGAVCHGPAGLVNVKLSNGDYLLKGKTVNSFTNEEEADADLVDQMPFLLESKLKERGATFKKSGIQQKHVEVSERLVTGQNPASATAVGEEMLKLLQSSN